jgi:hypothetical protein
MDAGEDVDNNGSWDALDCQGPAGADGATGPQGPSGVVAAANAFGLTTDPSPVLQFLAPPVSVTVAAGQSIHVVSTAVLGTNFNNADDLDIAICFQGQSDTSPTKQGGNVDNLQMIGVQMYPFTLSSVMTLPAGTYDVGLCGQDFSGFWDRRETGKTTALVFEAQ